MKGLTNGNTDADDLRSPLAKRKRLLSERSVSRLKQGFLAEDLAQSEAETASDGSASAHGTPGTPAAVAPAVDTQDMEQDEEDDDENENEDEEEDDDDDDDSTDSDDSSDEEDDDFLARALGEEMR